MLREQIGVDPSNPFVVLNLAAIGITNGTWRNSPLEDWHGEGRIHDGEMLRVNVATTKLVHEMLTDHLGEIVGDEGVALTAIEDLADLEADFSDELFVSTFERLADPVRVLPDGRTLRQLAGEDLNELVDHMDRALGGIAASAERRGLDLHCGELPLTAGWRARIGGERRGDPNRDRVSRAAGGSGPSPFG